jgi:hypothetical protein
MAKKKKAFSKLSIQELKNLKSSTKRKATIEKKKIDNLPKTDQRKTFESIISKNKEVEKIENQIFKKKLENKIKSNKQLIDRNKGNKVKVLRAEFNIEILQEKIKNKEFKEPEIVKNVKFVTENMEGNFFTYSSAFYYFNETKKKLLEMVEDGQIKSLNRKTSLKSISQLINEMFLNLDSNSAVLININMDNDNAFIERITMEEAKENEPLI